MHGRIFTKGLSTEQMQVCTHNHGQDLRTVFNVFLIQVSTLQQVTI